jgi:biotin carboxyl carrier protein
VTSPTVVRIADGEYLVTLAGRSEVVYVVASGREHWAFSNGEVYRRGLAAGAGTAAGGSSSAARSARGHSLEAPMPATVVRILVREGDAVRKGDTLVVLEAMKMELPLRAPMDGVVAGVRCREGDLVQPDGPLVELR